MITKLEISSFQCHIAVNAASNVATYLIYPQLAELEDGWLQRMARDHSVNVVAIYVPADKWNDSLTPWPEPGEAKGCPPFAGEASEFLKVLQTQIIPHVEKSPGFPKIENRDLMGVSLGGLFTLWQWLLCDTFRSIACLSGSFWYVGFLDWFNNQSIPSKPGKAFFLLGEEEPLSHVKAFQSVGSNTETIVKRLKSFGIQVEFQWVPGNHFSRPVHRAELALNALYS